ncbi:MAG: PEP/pyruvate-binding domain-containing protein [Acidobacteriota bacterium]
MTPDRPQRSRFAARVQSAWRALGRRASESSRTTAEAARFRLMYERFREILSYNDSTLQLIADIEDRLVGGKPFALDAVIQRVRKAAMDVFIMVKDLNQISGNRETGLYDALRSLNEALEAELPGATEAAAGELTVPLAALRASDAAAVGTKMANLGEVMAACSFAVPSGFAITTSACHLFMSENGLWERAERLEGLIETHGPEALTEGCHQVAEAILAAPVPERLAWEIMSAYDHMAGGAEPLVAMRSSAVGEDTRASHAGQYHTELNVPRERLLDAYRLVLAGAYSPTAVSYRYELGMTAVEASMAVGCMRMLRPRCAGIMFSRKLEDPAADAVVISAVPGTAAGVASGEQGAAVWLAEAGRVRAPNSALLHPEDVSHLVKAARCLENIFGGPQEIEWALEPDSGLAILQSRPVVLATSRAGANREAFAGETPILVGGLVACPGAASGPVVLIRTDHDLDAFPAGGVLVARHSSPIFSRVMPRCAAIVTDVGSPTGHMASLAREFGVPALVGAGRATAFLQPGEIVTVDATGCQVFAGLIPFDREAALPRPDAPASPALVALRRIARLITPLNLTDPAGPSFTPAGCRSLHDITRFVHEKTFEAMFHYGDLASADRHTSHRLEASLPIEVRVFDVGGGLAEGAGEAQTVLPSDLVSAPMQAFLAGLMDPRVRWDQPRPLSARGFLSVLGQSMAGPPAEALKVGRQSYAIISDRYMNFSTKAGYHFSTVDTYCGQSLNKNYIHFRFAGGAANPVRRSRRVQFLSTVLTQLDFRVQWKGDLLVARFEKYDQETIRARLAELGRLTLCARQLDMLMDSDASPDFFARNFLEGKLERF